VQEGDSVVHLDPAGPWKRKTKVSNIRVLGTHGGAAARELFGLGLAR